MISYVKFCNDNTACDICTGDAMDVSNLTEGLERAMLTEEKMAVMLLDLCDADELPSEIPAAKRNTIREYLLRIRDESKRHASTVSGLIKKLSGGRSDGHEPATT